MAYNLVLEPACIDEIAEQIDFLEAQRPDLLAEFYDELYDRLLFIERNPEVYQIQKDNLRRGLLSRFNYLTFGTRSTDKTCEYLR